MARKALIVKQQKLELLRDKYHAMGKKMPMSSRYYNRCKLTGRTRGFMREFGVNMVTFRKYAREGMIMGVKKASW